MANKIGPVAIIDENDQLAALTALPVDEQEIDVVLRAAIVAQWTAIPHLTEYVKIESDERFPDTGEEDIEISTVPDPIVSSRERTSIIQIGLPTVEEFERTGDRHTQLNFIYPIKFDLEVVDKWDNSNAALYYPSSARLFMAIYMSCRRAIKVNRTLGYRNVVTNYLQMINVDTVEVVGSNDSVEGRLHTGDWSLEVKCTEIYS